MNNLEAIAIYIKSQIHTKCHCRKVRTKLCQEADLELGLSQMQLALSY